ncbi:hypothetical protein VB779_06580 [Haloarculaceae archaeon H-GB11]|nr:hypothetical protein [Haloarculaceae archaeon H-GB11]
MPVFLENHDAEITLRPGTTKSDIVVYLYQNPEWGYSPQDIKEALDIPRGTATTTLKRLYDEDYIGKTTDGYYHALGERGTSDGTSLITIRHTGCLVITAMRMRRLKNPRQRSVKIVPRRLLMQNSRTWKTS